MKQTIHSLFVPHEHNNYRAKALHTHFLTFYLLVAIALTFVGKQIHTVNPNVLGYATDITTQKLFELTNAQRKDHNLVLLTYNNKLANAAEQKAENMFLKNYWAHYAPDGTTPWNFILNSGYQYEFAGENLAKNFMFSQDVVTAWMNSPTHRDNILRKEYTEIGFAIKNGVLNGEETTLVVQMFGKPLVQTQTTKETEPQVKPLPQGTSQSPVLGNQTPGRSFNFSSLWFRFDILFLVFLMIALITDLFFALRINVSRIGGKNMAHLLFVGFILVGIFIIAKGSIQ